MKSAKTALLAILLAGSPFLAFASNPFSTQTINIQQSSNSPPTRSFVEGLTATRAEELKKAFELLARTKAKFTELVRQVRANPDKFKKNGSLQEISQRLASIQKRLSESAAKLSRIYNGLPLNQRPEIPDSLRNPATSTLGSSGSGSTIATPKVAGNAPAARPMNVSGQVTSKSPGFKGWLENGVRIAQDWKFPDITNQYGEKITREHFLKAIMYIESGGVHQRSNGQIVTSSCGALGFMQLMPRTAQGLGVNPRDPQQNIAGGSKYFKTVFNTGKVGGKTGLDKLIMAGCAYNCGPYSRRLDQSWSSFVKDSNAPKETRRYGLKLKMCLGLQLTTEEQLVVRQLRMTGSKSLEQYARDCYSYTKGIGQ